MVLLIISILLWITLSIDDVARNQNVSKSFRFRRNVQFHRQMQILIPTSNRLTHYTFPVGLLISMLNAVVLIFLAIKLHNTVPLTLTIFCGCVVLLVEVGIHLVVPLFSTVALKLDDLTRLRNLETASRSSNLSRRVRSCCPVKFQIRPFSQFGKTTRTELLAVIFYYTASLSISI